MKPLPIVIVLLALGACASGPRGSPPVEVYDFGSAVEQSVREAGWSSIALEVRAPSWLDSSAIEYRLLYDSPFRLRSYSLSRWAGGPAQLLAQRLRQQLGMAGSSGRVAVSCVLRFELEEFAQLFDTPERSRGSVRGRAKLLDARHRIVAERAMSSEQPAATGDARGAVRAMVAAGDSLAGQFASWLNDLDKRGRLTICRPSAGDDQEHSPL
ncbi:ABC-type transport auxiliary lipoprotein family protein [Accumulibacter sp.]|uniref:ABC-type transport auxiliary lipoprotein family protein n=1 Tax=Accumulibacter sp. TaxID=2053492 RepID=UPI0025FCD2B5|nr:ABC-type transport auxiliary lipoprotein family protein [Accumulibacter sp.]MCM8596021.1 PqiC family protein [Accumulibacter sp.]MCM8626986.1 PqiC family protein [Accumulibacter sp.]MDS4050170.1 ABC-type transport auxiliary lipoprotein family protein [Accumulibacter sp.]